MKFTTLFCTAFIGIALNATPPVRDDQSRPTSPIPQQTIRKEPHTAVPATVMGVSIVALLITWAAKSKAS